MRHLRPPQVEHLQTLFLSRLILHVRRHVACSASLLVSCPLPRQGQPEVEQGMVMVRDVAHKHTDLAVVDLAPVAAPLALHAHRMRPALGEAAGIEGDDAIGGAQPLGHLSDSYGYQGTMIPWHRADAVLDDLALHIDPCRDGPGILAWQLGQEPLEVEMHGVVGSLGRKRPLVGYDERTETIEHLMEDVRGHETIAQQCFSSLCPRRCHLFASSHCPVDTGCCLEAIVITIRYGM